MLTIFCTAKDFSGRFKVIQENAIRSWTLLRPRPEIVLLGDGEGYAAISRELGIRHYKDVECNEHGTPLLSSMFGIVQRIASNPVVCYLDADIIITQSFMGALEQVARALPAYLMVGCSFDHEVDGPLDFGDDRWGARLAAAARAEGRTHGSFWGMDYFAFPRQSLPPLPPFAVGRPGWDNWLVYFARRLGLPVVDASHTVTAVHQRHDFSHHPQGFAGLWEGPEAREHERLIEDSRRRFSTRDATHIVTARGVQRAVAPPYLWRRLYTATIIEPRLVPLRYVLESLLRVSHGAREKAGLTLAKL